MKGDVSTALKNLVKQGYLVIYKTKNGTAYYVVAEKVDEIQALLESQ